MHLMKFDPYARTTSLSNLLDGFFNDDAITGVSGSDSVSSHPAVNIAETEEAYKLEVAAPGLAKDDFNIAVEKNHLTISAEKNAETEETNGRFTRREFNYTTFRRSFRLPRTVEQDDISAAYENGVLSVTLPKKTEVVKSAKPKAITVS